MLWHVVAYRGKGVGRADIRLTDAPGRQHRIEVIVIARHDMVLGAPKDNGAHNVDAVGVQRKGIMRQCPAEQQQKGVRAQRIA